MSSTNLFSIARAKLQPSSSTKDTASLHRWVLLKNSLVQSVTDNSTAVKPSLTPPPLDPRDEAMGDISESFIYPDIEKCSTASPTAASEAQWFNSLWEELDEDDDYSSGPQPNVLQGEDDEESLISPLPSPMSSSDDLTIPSYFSSPSMSYPYPFPVPYPPFHPPLISPCYFDSEFGSAPCHDHLPYFDIDQEDFENLPVPDAIEDTSDDESESPTTPSLGLSASLHYVDPASVPLPLGGSRLRPLAPHVYSDSDDSFLKSFDFEAVPFPNPNYPLLDEC